MIGFLRGAVFAACLVSAPAFAADEAASPKAPTPSAQPQKQGITPAQKIAQQKKILADLEENVMKPLLKKSEVNQEGSKRLHQKLLKLKGRADKGEDIEAELVHLKINAERALKGSAFQVGKAEAFFYAGYKTMF